MNAKIIPALVVLAGFAAAPAVAMAANSQSQSDPTLFGRTQSSIEQQLHAKGLDVTDVQAWGQYLRATLEHPNGGASVVLINPDTMQEVQNG